MKNFFLRSLPSDGDSNWLNVGLVAGGIVFFVLFFLRPYGLDRYSGSVFWLALSFAALSVVVTWAYCRFVLRPWVRRVPTWRVWHQCLSIFLLLCCICLSNFLLDLVYFGRPASGMRLLAYLYSTFLLGIPITLVMVGLDYQRRLRTRLAELLQGNAEGQAARSVTFHDASVHGEQLTLPMPDFLYAEAQRNFVDIYFRHADRVECRRLRSTLSAVLAEAEDRCVFQCHRSFIVNLNNILSARGNASGYVLTLGDDRHLVPVSRNYVSKLRSFVR
jgi:hypothetical protein